MQNHLNQNNQYQQQSKMAPPLIICFRNWKAQNQILVFATILFLTILSIVYILSYYFLKITIQELQNNSNLIFQQEKNKQIHRYSQLQLQITKQYFQSGTSELQRLNEMFQMVQKGINITQPSDCIFNFDESDPYERSCQFCYGFCNQTNMTNLVQYENMVNFSAMLTEYAALLDLNRQTYFTGITEDQYFSMYSSPVKSGFQSHKRQWYLDHMAQMNTGNELIVSDPYFSQLNQIHMAQTFNLTNLNNEFIGIIAKDGDFSNMARFQNSQIIPTIINYKGDLVISDCYQTIQNVLKFYQTNLTGYSEEDWNIINDVNIQEQKPFTIELYNSIYNQKLLLSITDMKNPQFFLMLYFNLNYIRYINDTEYNRDEEILFNKFYEFQYDFLIFYFSIFSIIVGILLIMQFISISLISKDLRKLTKITYQNIQSQRSTYKYNCQKMIKFQNQTIRNLFYAYESLIRSLTNQRFFRRNFVCQYLELIKYPLVHRKIDKNIKIKNLVYKTKNTLLRVQKVKEIICSSLTELYKNSY